MIELNNLYDNISRDEIFSSAKENPQKLSFSFALDESTVEELKDCLDWNGVSARSELLSEDFLYKYVDRLNLYNLIFTRSLSGKFLCKIVSNLVNQDIRLDLLSYYQEIDNVYLNKLKMVRELVK